MAKVVGFKLNEEGVKQLMMSDGMRTAVEYYAGGICERAGEGYKVKYGKNRVVAFVETETNEAAQDNLDNNTLLKAVRG